MPLLKENAIVIIKDNFDLDLWKIYLSYFILYFSCATVGPRCMSASTRVSACGFSTFYSAPIINERLRRPPNIAHQIMSQKAISLPSFRNQNLINNGAWDGFRTRCICGSMFKVSR